MTERPEWEQKIEEAAGKLNLKWYQNEDKYSDGDVENDIIKYIAQNEPENYTGVITEHFSWLFKFYIIQIPYNHFQIILFPASQPCRRRPPK